METLSDRLNKMLSSPLFWLAIVGLVVILIVKIVILLINIIAMVLPFVGKITVGAAKNFSSRSKCADVVDEDIDMEQAARMYKNKTYLLKSERVVKSSALISKSIKDFYFSQEKKDADMSIARSAFLAFGGIVLCFLGQGAAIIGAPLIVIYSIKIIKKLKKIS